MTDPEAIAARLRERVTGRVETHAPLAGFTSFRVGGPADVLFEAESVDDLVALADVRSATDADVAIVGRGSNLLVADDGFRGIAVRLGRAFREHSPDGNEVVLGGAVHLPAAARLTARLGLQGFEFAAEIPGTFGGAVRMNGGAHGRSMSDVIVEVTVVDLRSGRVREVPLAQLGYGYRHSALSSDEIVTKGTIGLETGEPAAIASQITIYLDWRRANQPSGRSAGSVFKNPEGDSAGRLIDAAGCKGLRIGGAEVSDVHANFIVADPDATAADVWSLIVAVQAAVRDHSAVDLEPEVRLIGEFRLGPR